MCYFERIEKGYPSKMTFEQIVEIAVIQNLELKVKQLETAIQREFATGAKLDMLPELLYTGEMSYRNNNTGSASESLVPGIPPAPPSISSEQYTQRWNITLTWSLLDFGISYFKSRQEANRALIKDFEREKLKQNMILDLSFQYWNAIAALEGLKNTEEYLKNLKKHEIAIVKATNSRLMPRTSLLRLQDQILDREYKLKGYERDYHFAMGELKRLMGLPPSVEFELDYERTRNLDLELPHVMALEEIALQQRPELYSFDLEEKISADEVRIAFLNLLPGSSLFAGYFYDENRFLVHNYWNVVGLKTAWDLLSIPTTMSRGKAAKVQIALAKKNRLALSLAAITQVNLAYLLFLDERDRYALALEIEENKIRQLKDAELKRKAGRFDIEDVLQVEYDIDSLDAVIQAWRTYSDVNYALEQLNNALGIPLYFKTGPGGDLDRESGIMEETL
jgi:outer membrane protein TolC